MAFRWFNWRDWRVDVRPAPHIRAKPGRLILSRLDYASEKCLLNLEWTPCNYGGSRAWFLCPRTDCARKVAILYYCGSDFACRQCRRLAYDCQQESAKHRALHAAVKVREKLGGSGSLVDPFPPKPKGMHWRTYERLRARADRHEAVVFAGIAAYVKRLEKTVKALNRSSKR